jgi:hypothetical protein
MEELPLDLSHHLFQFLSAPCIFRCLQINKYWSSIGKSKQGWMALLLRDGETNLPDSIVSPDVDVVTSYKKAIWMQYCLRTLSRIQWNPLCSTFSVNNPSAREGHCMCILGNSRVIITGGFCEDDRVHSLFINPPQNVSRQWEALPCRNTPSFVYGATLTALNETTALRFGGFRSGGYVDECKEVWLMELIDGFVSWKKVNPRGSDSIYARAYHSATLMHNRYLVILGGMQSNGSILQESILDTHAWVWLDLSISDSLSLRVPSGRHGQSAVLDSHRNRLVMFGGGNGADLLRSGVDNTEVWELQFGECWESNFEHSFPWKWNCLYKDKTSKSWQNTTFPLSPAQCLCLGRCHVGLKVSRDSVILACGSGRPTNNGIIGFNLASDSFLLPQVTGPIPVSRLSPASTVIGSEGWILIHGGYSLQGGTLEDAILLDLVPDLKRIFKALPEATGYRMLSARPVEELDLLQNHPLPNRVRVILQSLFAAPEADRQLLFFGLGEAEDQNQLSDFLSRTERNVSNASQIENDNESVESNTST